MQIIKIVSYEEVRKIFKASHPFKFSSGFSTNSWALNQAIHGASRECDDSWAYVELEPSEITKIFLPWHEYDCEKGNPVIPQYAKMNVADTATKIKNDQTYPARNSKCWSKINYWLEQEKIAPLFLSTQPVHNLPEHDAYKDLAGEQGDLFHLDGFHRLMSWHMKENFSPVYAYVAGVEKVV